MAFASACGCVAAASSAFGQRFPTHGEHRALPCRPTIACTADIVQDGAFEVEVGAMERRIGRSATQLSTPYLLKLTLAPWVQIQVGGNGYVQSDRDVPARYFDSVTVGPKFHLLDQTALRPALAASLEVGVPTWSAQLGYRGGWNAFATVYVTKDFGWLHIDLNLGVSAFRLDAAPLPQGFVALALSGALTRELGAMIEAYAFSDAGPVAPNDGGILSALTWSPRTWITFDVGSDIGFFPRARAFGAFVGMTVIVGDLWDSAREARVRAPAHP